MRMIERPTIGQITCQELCRVSVTSEDRGITIGFCFGDVMARVRERRVIERGDTPEKARQSSQASIQWYEQAIKKGLKNYEHYTLPDKRFRTNWSEHER